MWQSLNSHLVESVGINKKLFDVLEIHQVDLTFEKFCSFSEISKCCIQSGILWILSQGIHHRVDTSLWWNINIIVSASCLRSLT